MKVTHFLKVSEVLRKNQKDGSIPQRDAGANLKELSMTKSGIICTTK